MRPFSLYFRKFIILSDQSKRYPLALSLPSSQQWFFPRGSFCSAWYVSFALLIYDAEIYWQWSQISPPVTHLFSPSILSFIVTLGVFEGLLVWYWIDLKLGQVLLYGGILGLITLFAGKQALSNIGDRRLGRK
jgi:Oligosaccharyltransferase subunit Ribophorin II